MNCRRSPWPVAALLALGCVVSCATEVARSPAQFMPSAGQDAALVIREPVSVALVHGERKVIRAGSEWRRVGRIAQGDVYRPTDGAFAVHGRNSHEAYLVVASGELVGFYLPGEGAFAPLPATVRLKTN